MDGAAQMDLHTAMAGNSLSGAVSAPGPAAEAGEPRRPVVGLSPGAEGRRQQGRTATTEGRADLGSCATSRYILTISQT